MGFDRGAEIGGRARIFSAASERRWDLIVVGGGITGAGVAREAARLGLSVLLVEAEDFASGTSSRSSKLVHGGLRYLAALRVGLAMESISERERLLAAGEGLIEPLDFLLADYPYERLRGRQIRFGLWLYDRLAGRRSARELGAAEVAAMVPGINTERLRGGFLYADAVTDDARLVLRVIEEAAAAGAVAINYAAAESLVRGAQGRVVGVVLRDREGGAVQAVRARAVVNATGAWADGLRAGLGRAPRMRPLRGSHLVFARALVPVDLAVSILHPRDRRPVYIYPWQGATLVGTTDLDHAPALTSAPRISEAELEYLLEMVRILFPAQTIGRGQILSTYAGVRPVVRDRTRDPSKASRDHVIWHEEGLWTVTGGKLTTFHRIARAALSRLRRDLPELPRRLPETPVLERPGAAVGAAVAGALADEAAARSLLGRFGGAAAAVAAAARGAEELAWIPGTETSWAELRWAARAERVVRLGDLLLRRTRVGHLLVGGGAALMPGVQKICEQELGWQEARWSMEAARYREQWAEAFSVPERAQ